MMDDGRRNTATFLSALILVMVADGLVTLFLVGQKSSGSSTAAHAWVQIVFGILFLALFVLQWRAKLPADGDEPGWMKMMNKAGLGAAVVLGLALTNYALLSAGVSTIRNAGVSSSQQLAALAFFVVVAVSTVAATLILFIAFPRWAEKALVRLKAWLTKHSRVILMAVFGLMGLLFAVEGVIALLG